VEDCCQAHGALYRSRKVGSLFKAGAFSFYPSKNLTVFGDGGMVTTDDPAIAARVRLLRDHGRSDKYTHVAVGYNLRFNDVQATTAHLGAPPILPEAEAIAQTTVSLPMFPALSDQDVEAVIAAVRDFFPESTGGA